MSDSAGSGADAIQLLTADHAEVEAMFRQIEADGSDDELVRRVVRELSVHAAVEEQILYPAMRKALPDGETFVHQAVADHQQVKETLAAVEGADEPGEREPLLRRLMADVRHHVEEEEVEFFPKLRASIGREDLAAMGAKLASAKKLAPTHPHPHAPNTPPGNIVGGVAAAVLDKARDALHRD